MLSKKAQLRIIYLVAGIGILLIALALAQEPTSSDLSKSYNPVTKEITIKNTILGVPTTEVAKLKLITAQMNFVSPGTDVLIAKIEINSKEEYVLALKQVEFYNKINGVKLTRTLKYKYLSYEDVPIDVPIYKEICDEKNKTCYNIIESYEKGTEKKEVWTDYPNTKTEIGTFTIGIFTDVYQGDYVEWVPTFFDTKIEEWATYVASSLHGQTFNLAETHAIGDGYDRLGSQFTIDFNASLKSVIKTGNASIAWLIGANGSVLASATFNVAGGDQYANFTIPYPLVAGKLYIVTCNNSNTMSSGNVYVNATGALGAYPYINNNVSWVRGYDAGTNSTRLWQVKGIVYTYQQADVTIILNNPKNQNNYTSSSITLM
jgi:hypothetical protein